MQEDFKNQLQNTIGLWRKRGQAALDHLLSDAKGELRSRLSQQGLAERWPALINVIEEFMPDLAPSVAGIIGRQTEPLADWLGVTVKNWEPYKMELSVSPQKHLMSSKAWESSSFIAMAELAGRWLIEKHAPPGDLSVKVIRSELEILCETLADCTVRCELDSSEFELIMAQLLKNRKAELCFPVLILSANDVLMSQVNFHFEILWAPLLK